MRECESAVVPGTMPLYTPCIVLVEGYVHDTSWLIVAQTQEEGYRWRFWAEQLHFQPRVSMEGDNC